jgi:hypothetical protein
MVKKKYYIKGFKLNKVFYDKVLQYEIECDCQRKSDPRDIEKVIH